MLITSLLGQSYLYYFSSNIKLTIEQARNQKMDQYCHFVISDLDHASCIINSCTRGTRNYGRIRLFVVRMLDSFPMQGLNCSAGLHQQLWLYLYTSLALPLGRLF